MLAIAGGVALLLGVAGIYGVIAYSVSQRMREIGIRLALGARNEEVTGMFVRHGARLAALGIVCGIAVALALTRLMSSMPAGRQPDRPADLRRGKSLVWRRPLCSPPRPGTGATMVDPVEAQSRIAKAKHEKHETANHYRPYNAALNSTRNVPNGWPRHSGLKPSSTTWPASSCTSSAAARPRRKLSPIRYPERSGDPES